jgi:glycerol uptake facilitator protein
MIVAGGCGTVAAVRYANYPMGPLGFPLIFGAAVALAVYATRDISGAHLNPAVTGAFAIYRPEECPKG